MRATKTQVGGVTSLSTAVGQLPPAAVVFYEDDILFFLSKTL
jgi:hypothetical protein